MTLSRILLLICGTLALAGCAAAVTPVVAVPGPNKDPSAFQNDEAACRSEASQATTAAGTPAGTTNDRWIRYFAAYSQCAIAHGDQVQPVPWTLADVGFGDPYPAYGVYGYGYPYGFGYGYPYFAGYPFGFGYGYGGFGYGGYGGFGYGGFGYGRGYGGFHGGGFQGGGGGGFHGGGSGGLRGGGGGFHH